MNIHSFYNLFITCISTFPESITMINENVLEHNLLLNKIYNYLLVNHLISFYIVETYLEPEFII